MMNYREAYYELYAKVADTVELLCESEPEMALAMLVKSMYEMEKQSMQAGDDSGDIHLITE